MTMTKNLVYYDTNIWVAWMVGESDKFYPQAKELIDRITSGRNVAVVPDLILLEGIHAIRKRVTTTSPYTGSAPEDYAAIRRKIDAITEDFVCTVGKMSKAGQVLAINPNLDVANHHARVLSKLRGYSGSLHTARGQNRYRYGGLGHADFEHAFLALFYNVPEFHTADRSFEDLKDDPDFSGMRFNIVKPL